MQTIFGIKPLSAIKNTNVDNIYHIGRFAIKKGIRNITLFKQLMTLAITPICKNKNHIVFIECDSKLLRILYLLGIRTTIIGKSVDYLGSETIPIVMTYDGLIEFYNNNKALVKGILSESTNFYKLSQSVVFDKKTYNYPLV